MEKHSPKPIPSCRNGVVNPEGGLLFRSLLENLPAGAYTCDPAGLITYFNPAAAQLWGRKPKLNDPADRFCGSHRLFSVNGAPINHDQSWMALALQDKKDYNGREIVIERLGGKRLIALAYANPILDAAEELIGAASVLIDITPRKESEEELRRAKEEAESASAARSEFMSRMSHEFRTPLNAILGFGQLLEGHQTNRENEGDVRQLLAAGRHLLGLVDQILDFSDIEAGGTPSRRRQLHAANRDLS